MNDRLRMSVPGLLLLGLCGTAAAGQVLKYQDADGHIYYTDTPMRGEEYRLLRRFGPDPAKTRFSMEDYWRNRATFTPVIDAAAARVQLHPALLHAVVQAESAYDPDAYSRAGAVGLMQLMPATAARYGVNSWDPRENVDGGARYLKDLMQRYDQDLQLALAAYNAGEKAVEKYGNRIPPYPETRRYVEKVLANLQRNRKRSAAQPTIR